MVDEWIKRLEEYGANTQEALERMGGDKELYVMCLGMLCEDSCYAQLLICGGSAQLCTTEAFDAAHTLKGVAANLGLEPLYAAFSELVEALRAKDEKKAREEYQTAVLEWERVMEILGKKEGQRE